MEVIYLFDSRQQVRASIVDGVAECTHHEHNYSLDATMPAEYQPRPGEYLGFSCADGRWRLFCITEAVLDDAAGQYMVEATDAAVDDLQHIIIRDKLQEDVTAAAAAAALLEGTEWTIGAALEDSTTNTTDAQWVSLWTALDTLAKVFEVRVTPYYVFEGGQLTAKKIDVEKDEAATHGLIYESQATAHNVRVTYTQRPITALYGLGKATEQESDTSAEDGEKQNANFADVVWSKANGDPADKPAGQLWVEDAEASAIYGRRENIYTANEIEDGAELLKATWEELQKQNAPKVTISGTIYDVEHLTGEDWRKVRLGDKVAIMTRAGETLETRVIKIDRDYVARERTKLTTGEELQTATSQIAGLVRANQHTRETLTIYRNKFHHDKALILLNADTILAQANKIDMHANDILSLRAGVDENEASITLANGRIDQQANEISLHGNKLVTLQSGVDSNAASITLANGRIDQQANEIALKASQASLELANGRIDAQAEEIALKASEASLELVNGRIDAQAEVIELKADVTYVDNLVAEKATITDLESVRSDISNLTTGLTTAMVLNASIINGNQVNGTYGSFDSLTHNGTLVSQRAITMGTVSTGGKALSAGGELDLQHSHAIIMSEDGTVTLGEVSAKGGNFNIADTKIFKDAVSAAAGGSMVYFSGYTVSGGVLTATISNGKSQQYYSAASVDTSAKTATVTVADNSTMSGAKTLRKVDVSAVYTAGANAGKADVTLTQSGWVSGVNTVTASNGKTSKVSLPSFTASGGTSFSSHKTTVYFYTSSVSGALASKTVDATSEYNAGITAGASSVALSKSWSGGRLTVTASNGKTSTTTISKGSETWSGTTCSFPIMYDSSGSTGYTCKVDASAVYNSGYAAGWAAAVGKLSVSGNEISGPTSTVDGSDVLYTITASGVISSITNPSQGYYMASGKAYAHINGGGAIASKSFSKSQKFS